MINNKFKKGELVRVSSRFTNALYYKNHRKAFFREDFFQGQVGVWIEQCKEDVGSPPLPGSNFGVVMFKDTLFFVLAADLEKLTE